MEAVFLVLFVAAAVRADPHVPCLHDEDCSLNGVCTAGSCVCDPGWTTLPFGVDGALSPGCGYLDLLPSPVSECGPACAFHGGEGGIDETTTSWGGSVTYNEADSKYWMFAAEMAQHCGLNHWTTNSQVVTATSSTPEGPFVRQAVAVPPWSHNPEIMRTPDGTWVIYTLGPGLGKKPEFNCTTENVDAGANKAPSPPLPPAPPSPPITVNFTIHSSTSPHGPWTATTMEIQNWNSSWTLQNPGNWNPAPVVAPDGSVRVMAHTKWAPWAGEVILEAPSWKGPYTINNRSDLIDHCAYCEEDPFMWKDKRGNWHVLYHRMFDPAGPLDPNWGKEDGSWNRTGISAVPWPGWSGGHAFSRDGLNWSPWTRSFNTSVPLVNGTVFEFKRRERPKLLFDKAGHPTHLFNGAIAPTQTYTIVAPINVPSNRK